MAQKKSGHKNNLVKMSSDKDAKLKALDRILQDIKKSFGEGAVIRLGERVVEKVKVIPTGSLGLDYALGIGGYPRGRIVEIFGAEASGKTTLALHAIAEVQKSGGIAAFIDAEHALNPHYASTLGVKIEDLFLSQPTTGEEALEIAERLARSGAVDLIVVDSVASLVPRAEFESEFSDQQVGAQARLMAKAMRKLSSVLNKTDTCAIFINQVRQKIGVMAPPGVIPHTTPGGLALKFHASVRVEIHRISQIKSGDTVIGQRVKVKVVKNKLAPPYRETEFDIIFGKGISKERELIHLGEKFGIVKRAGAWYSYKGKQLGQGIDNAVKYLEDHKEILEEIEKELRSKLFVEIKE